MKKAKGEKASAISHTFFFVKQTLLSLAGIVWKNLGGKRKTQTRAKTRFELGAEERKMPNRVHVQLRRLRRLNASNRFHPYFNF